MQCHSQYATRCYPPSRRDSRLPMISYANKNYMTHIRSGRSVQLSFFDIYFHFVHSHRHLPEGSILSSGSFCMHVDLKTDVLVYKNEDIAPSLPL